MPSPRLVAFLEELDPAMARFQPQAEALILRVPGEGQPGLTADAEAEVLIRVAEGIMPPVRGWVAAVNDLATAERAWGPSDNARRAARQFNAATEEFLAVWDHLLQVQPATAPMRHVLGLIHIACYEFFLSGPTAIWRSARDIVEGKAEARLTFEPNAPSLRQATHELNQLRRR